MEEERQVLTESRSMITPGGYRFVFIWSVCLLLLYAICGYFGAGLLRGYSAEAAKIRQARIESPAIDPNAHAPCLRIPSGKKPVDVLAGGRINHIGEFNLKESAWAADFNLWFNWSSGEVNPGEGFRIVNGEILRQEGVESYRSGKEQYAEHHVVAQMAKQFDASRVPFGEEWLFIQVEDAAHGPETLQYVADRQGSGIGPDAIPPQVKLVGFMVDVKAGGYRSGQGKPDSGAGKREGRSQLILAMLIVPRSISIYQKMFQALFASVAIALVALFIKPIHVDPRFGLPVGAFFAAVGNNVFISTLLPNLDRLTLTDMVNATGLATIFLVLVQSAASLYILDTLGSERLSRLFDRVSFAVFLLGYVAVNLALPLAAGPL